MASRLFIGVSFENKLFRAIIPENNLLGNHPLQGHSAAFLMCSPGKNQLA